MLTSPMPFRLPNRVGWGSCSSTHSHLVEAEESGTLEARRPKESISAMNPPPGLHLASGVPGDDLLQRRKAFAVGLSGTSGPSRPHKPLESTMSAVRPGPVGAENCAQVRS